MRKSNNFILLMILAVLVGGVGWFFMIRERKPLANQIQGEKQTWYCPMHPWIKSDKPGVCPICGMAFVPGHTHLQQQSAATIPGYVPVDISQEKQQLAAIRTDVVGKKTVTKTIRAAGTVAYDEDLYKAETQYVEDYIALKRLDRRVNQGSYTIIDAERKLKEEELDLIHMGATEQAIDQIQKNQFPDHSLLVTHGQGAVIFAQVFGSDLGFIDVGQKAKVEIPDLQETYDGVVKSIDPVIDPDSRTARVRIYIPANVELHSNAFVRVSMPVELDEAIVIPRDAVMDTGLRKVVFVEKNEGTFEPRIIHTGWETDDGFEVKSGLKEGELIVVSGNFLLDSEARVQAVLQEGGDNAS
jgi:Cu(I)/Ag(I) efflux system membrane fusion protein